ncbi:MAG: hypothetical protein A2163_00745 [Actinobacteria bacterium RBG_13_35_12]|nr:MAG: hypothetical protein A2163_00745 [Actinobacteria bacterium RBG_13_35_12]
MDILNYMIITEGAGIAILGFCGVAITGLIKFIPKRSNGTDYVSKELCAQTTKTIEAKHLDLKEWTIKISEDQEDLKKTVNNIDKNVAVLLTRIRETKE